MSLSPVYTEPAECQDCYRCLRECPVKAIRIIDGAASIIPEECIMCGHCVEVCPAGAKKIRNDVDRVKQLIFHEKRVVLSIAPSWRSYYNDSVQEFSQKLKHLGVIAAAETAEGAEIFSRNAFNLMQKRDTPAISTACPVSVSAFLRIPEDKRPALLNLLSPALLHSRILKKRYGDDVRVVFIGPCIAKKGESDRYPDSIFAALTFPELDQWLEEASLHPFLHPSLQEKDFVFQEGNAGNFFPQDGGICETVSCLNPDFKTVSFSGLSTIPEICSDQSFNKMGNLFIEHSACTGSCINGPAMRNHGSLLFRKSRLKTNVDRSMLPFQNESNIVTYPTVKRGKILEAPEPSWEEIQEVLHATGKFTPEDEKNCGGCGYSSCRDFAVAVIQKKAEKQMCLTWIRKLSEKKTDAILNSMPSGVIIVDSNGIVVQSNLAFAKLAGPDVELAFEAQPSLTGADLRKLLPFANDFLDVFDSKQPVLIRRWKLNNRIVEGTLFVIEKTNLVGAVIRDITDPYVSRDRIISKARQVLEKNVETVQQIAFLLGENASETEVMLNSIVESFSNTTEEDIDS